MSPTNTSTTAKTIYSGIQTTNIFLAVIMLIIFMFGLILNTLFLWVLWFRIRKTVNSIWFLHLILSNLIFSFILPFLAVQVLRFPHWILGLVMCKLLNSLVSVVMFESAFVLTVISINRYLLVFQPHWYRRHMKPRYATIICIFLWVIAIVCSSPYAVFRKLKNENTTTECYNDYTLSGDTENLKVKWSLFTFRVFVGYLLPFFVILYCYFQIALKMKKEKLTRSKKPYKIIIIAVISFFVCWLPYHLWYGMSFEKRRIHDGTMEVLKVLSICFICFNFCFTPIFYLFIVENFKKMFKKSMLSLVEIAVNEDMVTWNRSMDEKSVPRTSSFIRDENHVINT
ncbi:probable G-protein coupled receptor 33 [Pelobates fuscus]|uniref:probable G-protein coupled receptor 33 n=1 Tax=Pelobates fuscus TaxID=191477 RepID=UPI002FE4AD8A